MVLVLHWIVYLLMVFLQRFLAILLLEEHSFVKPFLDDTRGFIKRSNNEIILNI